MNALSVRLENGIGVERDSKAACKRFQIAALYGSATAERNLAICYSNSGKEEKAFELLTKLAESRKRFHVPVLRLLRAQ